MEAFEFQQVPDCSAVSQLQPATDLFSDTLILVSQREPDQYTDTGYMSKYSTVGDVSRYVSSDFDMIGVREDISKRVKYSDLCAWGDLSINAIPPKVINGLRIECGIPKDISSYDLSAGMDWDFKHYVFDCISADNASASSLYVVNNLIATNLSSVRSDIGLFGFESATSSVVPASIDGLHDSLYVALAKLEKRIAAIERGDSAVLLEDGFELNTAKRPVMKSKASRTTRSTGKTVPWRKKAQE